MNTVPLDGLQLREVARQLLNKPSKNSSGLVSERLLIPIAWEFMSYCDKEKIFAHPVSNREAPNYSSIIEKRMALSNMKTKGNYGTLESFGEDIQLIVKNCKLYNDGDTSYMEYAEWFLAAWNVFYTEAAPLRKTDSVKSTHVFAITATSSYTAETPGESRSGQEEAPQEHCNKRKMDTNDIEDSFSTSNDNQNNPALPVALSTSTAVGNIEESSDIRVGTPTAASTSTRMFAAPSAGAALPAGSEVVWSKKKIKLLKFLIKHGDEASKPDATRELLNIATKMQKE